MRNTGIYHTAIDRRNTLKLILNQFRDQVYTLADWEVSPYERSKLLIDLIAQQIENMDLVVWNPDLFRASQKGLQSFDGYKFDHHDWPPAFQHWQFASPELSGTQAIYLGCEPNMGVPEGTPGRDMFVFPTQGTTRGGLGLCFSIIYWPLHEGSLEEAIKRDGLESVIPIFRFWPSIFDGEAAEGYHQMFLAALGFMYSKVVSLEPIRAHRAERRRAHKLNKHLPTIQITHLRRREYQSGDQRDPGSWSCRWIVRGHWRKQWYPKDGLHKPLFIEPHIKGPDGAPLKPPREHITVVAR